MTFMEAVEAMKAEADFSRKLPCGSEQFCSYQQDHFYLYTKWHTGTKNGVSLALRLSDIEATDWEIVE